MLKTVLASMNTPVTDAEVDDYVARIRAGVLWVKSSQAKCQNVISLRINVKNQESEG